jgi:hypothetical protein
MSVNEKCQGCYSHHNYKENLSCPLSDKSKYLNKVCPCVSCIVKAICATSCNDFKYYCQEIEIIEFNKITNNKLKEKRRMLKNVRIQKRI